MNYSPQLQEKIIAYYEKYYQSCGLSDYRERAKQRLEEELLEPIRMRYLQEILNKRFIQGEKHFIFGAGTGGLAVSLFKEYGCDVYGIEPCPEEFAIIQGKCKEVGINPANFRKEFGEKLSFKENQFDLVHCFNVLEHVNDIKKCIEEMIRITKPGGYIYINNPNYSYPIERHYKIPFPTFLPKIFGYFYLMLLGKPYKFLKSINFVTEKGLNKILNEEKNIYWFRVYKPSERDRGLKYFFLNFIRFNLFIYPKQEIIIKKYLADQL